MNTKGFTLIELLVVVLIIGILASIALPQYTKAVEKSRAAEAIQLAGAIEGAYHRHFMQYGNNGVYGEAIREELDLDFPTSTQNYDVSIFSWGAIIRRKGESILSAGFSDGSRGVSIRVSYNQGTGETERLCFGNKKNCQSFGLCTIKSDSYYCYF
ncbi:prepilin-type N-terminal cleavage/methylation domain-containing protein [Elusimicrobium posterum]|uniref:type IV pilin protein n=1 Tax=Elusimicrobium posterum TaxID=3116653 RepID=UPI003C74CD22